MPPALFNKKTKSAYSSRDEMLKQRKSRDNVNQKLRYWRKTYGYDLKWEDYETFNSHVPMIKKIHHIHEFVCNFDKTQMSNMNISENLDLYVKNQKAITDALTIREYLKTLTRFRVVDSNQTTQDITSSSSSTTQEQHGLKSKVVVFFD
jgi:hypothetical protein